MGSQRVGHDLATKQQQKILSWGTTFTRESMDALGATVLLAMEYAMSIRVNEWFLMIFSFVFTPNQGLDLLSGISAFSHLIQGLVRFLVYVGREFPKASQVALVEKNPPASAGEIRDTGSIPGSGEPLEKEMATHSVFFPGKYYGKTNFLAWDKFILWLGKKVSSGEIS